MALVQVARFCVAAAVMLGSTYTNFIGVSVKQPGGYDLRQYEQGDIPWYNVVSDGDIILSKVEKCEVASEKAVERLAAIGCFVQSKKLMGKYYTIILSKLLLRGLVNLSDSVINASPWTYIEVLATILSIGISLSYIPHGFHPYLDRLAGYGETLQTTLKVDRIIAAIKAASQPRIAIQAEGPGCGDEVAAVVKDVACEAEVTGHATGAGSKIPLAAPEFNSPPSPTPEMSKNDEHSSRGRKRVGFQDDVMASSGIPLATSVGGEREEKVSGGGGARIMGGSIPRKIATASPPPHSMGGNASSVPMGLKSSPKSSRRFPNGVTTSHMR